MLDKKFIFSFTSILVADSIRSEHDLERNVVFAFLDLLADWAEELTIVKLRKWCRKVERCTEIIPFMQKYFYYLYILTGMGSFHTAVTNEGLTMQVGKSFASVASTSSARFLVYKYVLTLSPIILFVFFVKKSSSIQLQDTCKINYFVNVYLVHAISGQKGQI